MTPPAPHNCFVSASTQSDTKMRVELVSSHKQGHRHQAGLPNQMPMRNDALGSGDSASDAFGWFIVRQSPGVKPHSPFKWPPGHPDANIIGRITRPDPLHSDRFDWKLGFDFSNCVLFCLNKLTPNVLDKCDMYLIRREERERKGGRKYDGCGYRWVMHRTESN